MVRYIGVSVREGHSGQTNEWLTPPDLVKSLGKFDLDPCAAVDQPWALARRQYTSEDNGLVQPWSGRVFCNPPYGPSTRLWINLMTEHSNGVLLIFARTETKAFFQLWESASAMLFLSGRLSFYYPDGTLSEGKPAASVLVAFDLPGSNANSLALRDCGYRGAWVSKFKVVGNEI